MYENELIHAGVAHDDNPPGRGSGRYGWGTGENPGQHQFDFLSEVSRLKNKGLSQAEIAGVLLGPKEYDKDGNPTKFHNSTDLRVEIGIATKVKRQLDYQRAIKLYDECNGNKSEAARRMGINESSFRSLINPEIVNRTNQYENTAKIIKEAVDKKGIIDVSSGVEIGLGITDSTKKIAVAMLEKEGYVKTKIMLDQPGGAGKKTTVNVLAPPGMTRAEIQANKTNVQQIQDYTPDKGKTWWTPEFPELIDEKRIYVRYKEDGGADKDGVIELRPGVEDISLDGSSYAQVRIGVKNGGYMKGMAVYGDIPEGYDIVYNTNKKKGTPLLDPANVYDPIDGEFKGGGKEVLKRMKINKKTGEIDRDNPFGALIKSPTEKDGVVTAGGQRHYIGKDGKEHLSLINKLRDEGDWDSWSRNLASQFLSKQPIKLINQQIELSVASKQAELDEILALTNPVIKKRLLNDFAQGCDSNAAKLSVKGFRKQAFQVLLPIPTLKDNEIYAPNYKDSDTVALCRYPHGGTFEIPILTVNNKHPDAIKMLPKGTKDAVGINPRVAEILSGADFDGDTALVIPVKSNNIKIASTKPLDELKGFDPKTYALPDSAPNIKNHTKQNQMGQVTNLINDMTVGGATNREIAKAVRHSMVVIDSEKHHLDYKKSAKDNDILELKKTYQGINPETGRVKGASTILSRAGAKTFADDYKEVTDTKKMNAEQLKRWNEGKKIYVPTGKTTLKQITDPDKMTEEELEVYKQGKKVYRDSGKPKQKKVYQMDLVDDAMDLVRDPNNDKELAYAKYANELKGLGNAARKVYRETPTVPVNTSSKKIYAEEVASLKRKLTIAKSNQPKERQATAIMNAMTREIFEANPDMDFEHRQREKARCMSIARAQVGAKRDLIEITDREWDAIQANAISTNTLEQIIDNTNIDALKKRATPRNASSTISSGQIRRIKAMLNSGMYTQAEIAEQFGISTSTISSLLKSS